MDQKLPVILSVMAAALTSCTQIIQQPEAQELVFSAVASHSAKSIISTTNYPLDEPFAVEAVYYPEEEDATSSIFMARETVQYSSGKAVWKTRNQYYWPKNGTLLFYAGSPIVPQVSVSADKGVEADWTAVTPEQTQTDLCFAKVTERCKAHSSAVPIVFSHALSQICFKARSLANYSSSSQDGQFVQTNEIKILLDSVKLSGLAARGHFTQVPLQWTIDSSHKAEYLVFRSSKGAELGMGSNDTPLLYTLNTLLLLPQSLGKDAQLMEWHRVAVHSSITDTGTGQTVSEQSYTLSQSSVIPLSPYCPNWLMDFKYTFRLALGMEETEMTTAITDWTEPNEIIIGDE